jgi:hypothetical protein
VKPKLLVVPHIYAEDLRIRDIEFAKRFTNSFEVFCLTWRDALHVDDRYTVLRIIRQI